jgi:NTE family protein
MADGVKKIERYDLTSLVLPGAVAKGAYEAGVIEVLVENEIKIDRIVATSSGALNAIALAAGIRAGHERAMAKNLVTAWIEKGGWFDTFKLNPFNLIRGRGLSGHEGISELIKSVITPCTHSEKKDIEVRIIVTPLYGVDGNIGDKVATTFEKVVSFTGEDFDTEEGLARIFEVTLAACSFPGIFSAVDVAGLGPCVDGGTVNNAPIHYAMDYIDVSHIIMPVPFPEIMRVPKSLGGFNLLSHLIEILINERLYRDLKTAETTNTDVRLLEEMVKKDQLSPNQLAEIKKILNIRNINIHEVRPKESLKVGSFSGFFSKNDRMKLVEEGREAMRAMLQEVKGP